MAGKLWQGVTLQTHQTCLNVNSMGHSHFKLFVNNKSSSKKCLQGFYQSYTWNINILWLTNRVWKLHRLSLINFNQWSLFLFFVISFSLWFTQWKKNLWQIPWMFCTIRSIQKGLHETKTPGQWWGRVLYFIKWTEMRLSAAPHDVGWCVSVVSVLFLDQQN